MTAVSEPVCDLRIGQVGVATLKLKELDLPAIGREMAAKVQAAPELLARAAVIVDLNAFPEPPGPETLKQLIQALRDSGVLPVGLTYGSPAIDVLARDAGLPLFSRFRSNYEADAGTRSAASAPVATERPANEPASTSASPGVQTHDGHVRSGQQIYARGRDLTVLGSVSAGAEIIADGSIHIYGSLRGRALAGAAGDGAARIFCREFHAELVAIAGNYRVLDDASPELHGRALQIRLDGERLSFEPL